MIPSAPLFNSQTPWLIGVVHLGPLPGSPGWGGSFDELEESARRDALALTHGCNAVIVENFGDAPFHKEHVPPETVTSMARLTAAVRDEIGELPLGVNVLRNDARSALALCAGGGADFLRVNVHCGAYVTDQGLVEGRADETLRERSRLCPDAKLLCDVHVKHAVPLAPVDLLQSAADTWKRGQADALIVTGDATGAPVNPVELARVREHLHGCPLLIGSGLVPENALALLEHCDGAIVGTFFKRDGNVSAPVERMRVERLRELLDRARN